MPNLSAAWTAARPLDAFIADAVENAALWKAQRARTHAPDDVVAHGATLGGPWRLLVLAEDWCGDAVNTVPLAAALADAVPGWELRVLVRDAHLDVMDQFLTGGARAIPIVILLDPDGEVRGHWGPRPAELQAWVKAHGMALDKGERYKQVRTWYVRDRGATTYRELLAMVAAAAEAADEAATETTAAAHVGSR